MPEPIEKLFVEIGADVSKLLNETRDGIRETEKELERFERKATDAFEGAGRHADGLGAVVGKLQTAFGLLAAAVAGSKIVGFFKGIGQAAVAANAQFETFESQFETLLGSAGAAQQRLEELARFGVETPFELPEVVQASRTLEVFGGAALATGDSLRMIGDIAAGVNQPFQSVAFWIGRMFDSIQSGRPFGEASMRLQEMGALSGETRQRMEDLQKAGADASEVFAVFTTEVGGKFQGNMERLSKTFQGVMSNLADFQGMLLRVGGEAFFEQVRDDAVEFLDIISDEDATDALNNLAMALGEAAAQAADLVTSGLIESIESIEPDTVDALAEALRDATSAINEFLATDFSTDLNGLVEALTIVIDSLTALINTMNRFKDVIEPIQPIIQAIRDAFLSMINPIGKLIEGFGELNRLIEMISGERLVDFSRDMADASETEAQHQRKLIAAYQELADSRAASTSSVQDVVDASEEVVNAFEEEQEALERLATSFIDLAAARDEKMAELETAHGEKIQEINQEHAEKLEEMAEEHGERMAEIEADAVKARADAHADFAKAIEKLERDTQKRQQEVIERARQDLKKLAEDTDRAIEKERKNFQKDELRETEDHLKDMRRLRMDFLDNLEDAVKNRDARAIVDLRRNFNRESQERVDDFNTRRQREREDQDERLREIRENEERRAQEIIEARDQELQNLKEQEAERRAELEASLQEQLLQIDTNLQERKAKEEADYQERLIREDERFNEQIAKENENFTKRQAELEKMLQKRLEDTAKALADEEKINEEGAKKILQTLNKVFGIGGDIDELMESFQNRRRGKLSVIVEFERQTRGAPGGPEDEEARAAPGPGRRGRGGGTRRGRGGGFARGGSIVADQPTVALFGEAGPELASFIPLNQMSNLVSRQEEDKRVKVDVAFSGSAPPGITTADRDHIAGVLISAFRDAGVFSG